MDTNNIQLINYICSYKHLETETPIDLNTHQVPSQTSHGIFPQFTPTSQTPVKFAKRGAIKVICFKVKAKTQITMTQNTAITLEKRYASPVCNHQSAGDFQESTVHVIFGEISLQKLPQIFAPRKKGGSLMTPWFWHLYIYGNRETGTTLTHQSPSTPVKPKHPTSIDLQHQWP